MKIWIATDSDGRILSSTTEEEYSEGMTEIEVPDDFDFDHQDDYIYKDGLLSYSQRPPEPLDPYVSYQQQIQASIPILTKYLAKGMTDGEVLQIPDLMPEYDDTQSYEDGSVVRKDDTLYRKRASESPYSVMAFSLDSFDRQWYPIVSKSS